MRINSAVELTLDGEIAVLTLDSPPVNALSPDMRDGLHAGLTAAIADPAVAAVVVTCAGRTFIAGGDIAQLGAQPSGAPVGGINQLLDSSPKPVVAAIHGAALGGGLELALSAHWRVAVASARCGLPEVKLGILPGGGGTQRLTRLVGAEKALDMIVFGEPISAREALAIGVFDALVEEDALVQGAVAFARRVLAEPRPLRRTRDRTDKLEAGRADPGLFDAFAAAHAERLRGAQAPANAIRSIRAAHDRPFDQGCAFEWEMIEPLFASLQSRAMRHIFFAERAIWKLPGVGRDATPPTIRKVAVIASTPAAQAIARALSEAGLAVAVDDGGLAWLDDCDVALDPTLGASTPRLDRIRGRVARERLIGLSLPADGGRFVEAARHDETPDLLASAVMQQLKRMGKIAVLTRWRPGGVTARMTLARQAAVEAAVAGGASLAQAEGALYDYGFPRGTSPVDHHAPATLLEALLFPIVNEGARVLEEGLAARASDIDVMAVNALGWPAYGGGPMFYGEVVAGLPKVVEGLRRLQAHAGEAFRPCALLERLAAEGRGFTDP